MRISLRTECDGRSVASNMPRTTTQNGKFRDWLETFAFIGFAPLGEPAILGVPHAEDLTGERGLIEHVLRFANGDETRAEHDRHEAAEAMRTRLRELLGALLDNKPAARRALVARAGQPLREVWGLPVLQREPHLHLSTRWVATSAEALEAFVSLLLLDEERPYGRLLRRCQLEGCGRFFLMQKPKSGVPRYRYCTREHMLEAHARTSYARTVKAKREKERRARTKPKRRR